MKYKIIVLFILMLLLGCKNNFTDISNTPIFCNYTLDNYKKSHRKDAYEIRHLENFDVIDEIKEGLGSRLFFSKEGNLTRYMFLLSDTAYIYYKDFDTGKEIGKPYYYEFRKRLDNNIYLNIYYFNVAGYVYDVEINYLGKAKEIKVEQCDSSSSIVSMSNILIQGFDEGNIKDFKAYIKWKIVECNSKIRYISDTTLVRF